MTVVLTSSSRTCHLDHRTVRGRRRGDPGRDRRPGPVRHRPGAGQARRPRTTRQALGHLHRPHQAHRPRPTTTPRSGVACGMGSPTCQPRLRRPLPTLTTREHNKLTATQAQSAIAAAILRHLHAVVTTGQAWDPLIATHGKNQPATPMAACAVPSRRTKQTAPGEPPHGIEDQRVHHGQPARRLHNPITGCWDHPPSPLCRDRRRARHRPENP